MEALAIEKKRCSPGFGHSALESIHGEYPFEGRHSEAAEDLATETAASPIAIAIARDAPGSKRIPGTIHRGCHQMAQSRQRAR